MFKLRPKMSENECNKCFTFHGHRLQLFTPQTLSKARYWHSTFDWLNDSILEQTKKNKKRNRNHRNVFSGRITLPGLWPVFTWPWRVNDSSSSRRGAGAFDLFVVLFPLVAVGRFFFGKDLTPIWRNSFGLGGRIRVGFRTSDIRSAALEI